MTDAETGCNDVERSANGSWYLPAYAEDYFWAQHHRIEYVVFEQRIASLAWLHNKITSGVDTELAELQEIGGLGLTESPAGNLTVTTRSVNLSSCSTRRFAESVQE